MHTITCKKKIKVRNAKRNKDKGMFTVTWWQDKGEQQLTLGNQKLTKEFIQFISNHNKVLDDKKEDISEYYYFSAIRVRPIGSDYAFPAEEFLKGKLRESMYD